MKKEKIKKIIIGILAGMVSGLFSTGGGLILLPSFIHILKLNQIEARATTIMCVLPIVIVTSIVYAKNNYIDWKIALMVATGGIIGSFIGSKILDKIPLNLLRIMFIIFLLYMGIRMIY